MDWKAPGNFFSSLNIAGRKMFYTSFWSFLHHMKTCKKNFWKILIFCRVFCNVFESTTTFGKEGMATMIFVPPPCNPHHFTTTSQEKCTESFIKISPLVSEIFNVLRYDRFHFYSNSAFMGTKCTHEGWICIKLKPIKTQNVKYLRDQWRYLDETFCGPSPWCSCKVMMSSWAWHCLHGCHAHFTEGNATLKHVTKIPTKN